MIRELVDAVILTGRVKGCYPISLLLIAAPESGKTSIVLDKPCKAVEAFTDVTGRGIHAILDKHGEITHIVINDLVAVLSHKQSVNRYTISQLNALTEEGITKIATPAGIVDYDGGRKGVIASLTLEMAKDARYSWNKVGFTSRMLPFCYYYPNDLIVRIKNHIDEKAVSSNGREYNGKAKALEKEFHTPPKALAVDYPINLSKEVRYISDVRAAVMKETGMRRLHQYHAIVQAHALLRHRVRPIVLKEDIDWLKTIDLYVSYTEARAL